MRALALAALLLPLAGGCTTLRHMTSSYKAQQAKRAGTEAAATPAEATTAPRQAPPAGLAGDKANARYSGAPVAPQ